MRKIFKGCLTPAGGRYWRCVISGVLIAADCECAAQTRASRAPRAHEPDAVEYLWGAATMDSFEQRIRSEKA